MFNREGEQGEGERQAGKREKETRRKKMQTLFVSKEQQWS